MNTVVKDITPAEMDKKYLEIIRTNVENFIRLSAVKYATFPGLLLDIAPQDYEGAKPFFPDYVTIETFDIDPNSRCTYRGDICKLNEFLENNRFDYVVCTEVLEHTIQPFHAVKEIRRILRPGGFLFLSVPFNFRIHGPLPDCWRFTEHGLRSILEEFSILELNSIETNDRPLMPVHYTVVAQK